MFTDILEEYDVSTIYCPEDGTNTYLQNFSKYFPEYMARHSRLQQPSQEQTVRALNNSHNCNPPGRVELTLRDI
jgi:hypothetical protein